MWCNCFCIIDDGSVGWEQNSCREESHFTIVHRQLVEPFGKTHQRLHKVALKYERKKRKTGFLLFNNGKILYIIYIMECTSKMSSICFFDSVAPSANVSVISWALTSRLTWVSQTSKKPILIRINWSSWLNSGKPKSTNSHALNWKCNLYFWKKKVMYLEHVWRIQLRVGWMASCALPEPTMSLSAVPRQQHTKTLLKSPQPTKYNKKG